MFNFGLKAKIRKAIETIRAHSRGDTDARIRDFSSPLLQDLSESFNRMADHIQLQFTELNKDKTQLMTILSNMVESVVAVEASGKVVMVNPALAQLFQIDEAAVRGRPLLEVLRHNQLNQLLEETLAQGKTRVGEVRTFSPSERVFEAHGVPLFENGNLSGALLVLHDITRLRQLEQMRREFVANVSHELRTPLATMKGYAETLRLGAIEDKENRMEFLKSIEDQAEQMTQLVDDLLDLAAIESGKRGLLRESIAMLELAQEVAKNLRRQSEQKKIQIKVERTDNLPLISGDRTQIKQILTNLLDNAIKFNQSGGEVKISFEVTDKFLRTNVTDTGMGIPTADMPRIFERFFRVDKARSRELGGTGLGLAIVKHIAEAHGGGVSVESVEGQGSTLSFFLPL